MTTNSCSVTSPETGARCVFGIGHDVSYHHGTDGTNWPKSRHDTQAPNVRLTPERLAEIRNMVPASPRIGDALDDVLAELSTVTRERDEARGNSAVAKETRLPTERPCPCVDCTRKRAPLDAPADQLTEDIAWARAERESMLGSAHNRDEMAAMADTAEEASRHRVIAHHRRATADRLQRIAAALTTHAHNVAAIAAAASDAPGVGI